MPRQPTGISGQNVPPPAIAQVRIIVPLAQPDTAALMANPRQRPRRTLHAP